MAPAGGYDPAMQRNRTWLAGWVFVWLLTMAPAHAAGDVSFSDRMLMNVAASASSLCCTENPSCGASNACQGACPCVAVRDCSDDPDGRGFVAADMAQAVDSPDELEPAPDPFPPKPQAA